MAAQDKGYLDANLIAAAEAAASWARARRAAWTRAPLDAAASGHVPLAPIEFESAPAAAPEPPPIPARPAPPVMAARATPLPAPPSVPPRPAPVAQAPPPQLVAPTPIVLAPRTPPPEPAPPPFVATVRNEDEARPAASSSFPIKWIAAAALLAAIAGAGAIGWRYLSSSPETLSDKSPQEDASFVGPRPQRPKATGALQITSTPAGAQVLLDGKARGVTPLTLKDLPPGKHDVTLKSDSGTVRRAVTVAANQTETVDEQIFSGWVTVYSPFEVTMAEGQRVLRPDDRNQVMLPPGTHELRLINKALAYEAVLQVTVKPGEGTNVRLTPAPSSLTVTASDAAEVLVDGVRAGVTPLNGFSVPLGTHEIVVRRSNGSEKRYTATIGVKAYTLNVDF